jgi:hypothetical protein
MAEMRRFGLADLVLLVAVLTVAASARIVYLMRWCDNSHTSGPLLVEDAPTPLAGLGRDVKMLGQEHPTELQALVHNLKEHQWFGSLAPFAPAEEKTAHVSPGYPWLLGLLARFLDPDRLEATVRWAQCGLGTLTAGLYFLFARRAFRNLVVAGLTGLACALYPFWIADTAALADGTLATFLLGLVLLLGTRASQTSGAFASFFYGLTLAALALVRAALLPFAFVALGWFLWRSRSLTRGWLCALLAFLGFANGLAPWTVRNLQVFREPVPVVDSAYLHLWIGNNPHATGGPATPQALLSAPSEELARIDRQTERYARLGPRVWDEVRADPDRALQRRVWAALYFLLGERWFEHPFTDQRLAKRPGAPAAGGTLLHASLLAVFALAFLGWRWTYAWRFEAMPSSLAVVWVPLPYILGHAEALHGPRLPLDGVLLCYAAFALTCLIPRVGRELFAGPAPGETADGHLGLP